MSAHWGGGCSAQPKFSSTPGSRPGSKGRGFQNLYDARGHVKGGGGEKGVGNNEGGWGYCGEGDGPGGGVGTGRRTLTLALPPCTSLFVSVSLSLILSHLSRPPLLLVSETSICPPSHV